MIEYKGKIYKKFKNEKKDNTIYNKLLPFLSDDIQPIGYYCNNGNTNILFNCKTYNTYFTKTLSKFKNNNNCPYCSGYTDCNNSYQFKLDSKFGKDIYKIVEGEEYKSNDTPILLKHICGHVAKYNPYDLLHNKTKCKCENWKWNKEKFQKLIGNDFIIIDKEVNGCNNPVHIIHKTCGTNIWISPTNFKASKSGGCKECYYRSMVKDHETFLKELNEKFPNEYTVIGTYKGYDIPIEIKHNSCGNIWTPTPNNLLTEKSHCPACSKKKEMSDGEKFICNILNEEGIPYIFNKPYEECKYKGLLKFDFRLNDYNNILIEFDGEQHFKVASFDKENKEEKLEERQTRDRTKTKYCIDNNLILIRIPYTIENDLDSIIQSILDGSYLEDARLFIIQNGKLHNQPEIYNYLLEESDLNE